MPPKSKTQCKTVPAANQDSCCICLHTSSSKDEILFCSGSCQKYLHRYCASVSELAFRKLSAEDAEPFLCFCYFRIEKEKQVQTLPSTVESLKIKLSTLKAASAITRSLSSLNDAPEASAANMSVSKPSYSAVTKSSTSPTSPAASSDLSSSREANHAKKLNVVLYGVQECPSGMSRSAQQDSDLSSVVSALSSIDPTIQSLSISNCFRLGKFSQSSRPRPILIRFIRVAVANRILTKRSNLSHPFSLKPDLPFQQRVQNSLLLKQRWKLIQNGVDRKFIAIRGDRFYVHKKLYGRVIDRTFVSEQSQQSALSSMDDPTSSENVAITTSTNQPQTSSIQDSQALVTSSPSDKAVNMTANSTTSTSSPSPVSISAPSNSTSSVSVPSQPLSAPSHSPSSLPDPSLPIPHNPVNTIMTVTKLSFCLSL